MAIGSATFADFGGAASDLFGYFGTNSKAQGDLLEAQQYGLAAAAARQNEKFTKAATAISEMQTQRQTFKAIGEQQAGFAASGFTAGGSALDIMRESASQGALAKQIVTEQGGIQVYNEEEQAKSYALMQQAATLAAQSEQDAGIGKLVGGGIKLAAGIATL